MCRGPRTCCIFLTLRILSHDATACFFSSSSSSPKRYDKFYHKQDAESFVRDFLNSEDVRRELLPEAGSEDVAEVCSFSAKPVKAVTTTMAFFDRLQQAGGVVRPNGQIVKCMDDYFEVSARA